jgi:hypothetical protein
MCCWTSSPVKIHRPRPGLNPRTLSPMANTLATITPSTNYMWSIKCVHTFQWEQLERQRPGRLSRCILLKCWLKYKVSCMTNWRLKRKRSVVVKRDILSGYTATGNILRIIRAKMLELVNCKCDTTIADSIATRAQNHMQAPALLNNNRHKKWILKLLSLHSPCVFIELLNIHYSHRTCNVTLSLTHESEHHGPCHSASAVSRRLMEMQQEYVTSDETNILTIAMFIRPCCASYNRLSHGLDLTQGDELLERHRLLNDSMFSCSNFATWNEKSMCNYTERKKG